MKPIVDGLEKEYRDRIAFKRVNANLGDGPAIMQEYRILGHPTLLFFDVQGQEVERRIGPQTEADVRAILEKLLPQQVNLEDWRKDD